MDTKGWLKIGDLARRTGIGVDALRFYEEKGILPLASRTAGGFRLFPPDSLERLDFVTRAKGLGFSLDEISDLLSLRSSSAATSHQVVAKVQEKIEEIERRIDQLRELREALAGLATTCDGTHPTDHCPILDHIAHDRSAHHGIA